MNYCKRRHKISLAIGILSLSATVCAAMTVNEVVNTAITQNPDVFVAKNNLQAALQERNAANSAWFPKVDFSLTRGRYGLTNPTTAGKSFDYYGGNATLQVSENLFNGFGTTNEVRRLTYVQQASYFDYLNTVNQVALESFIAYIDVIRYKKLSELASNNAARHKEILEKLTEKVKAGVGRGVDLELAQGRLALAESNLYTELGNLNNTITRYIRLTAALPPKDLTPVADLNASQALTDGFLASAVKSNPKFQSSVATLRAFRADNEVRKSAMYPTLDIRASRNVQNRPSGVVGDYQTNGVEVVLNYNLFNGGGDIARTKQYAAKYDSALSLRDKICADVLQTGRTAVDSIIRLQKQMGSLNQHQLSIAKARQAYQQQFDIGQRTLLDLLDIENEYFQSSRALEIAVGDLQIAKATSLNLSGSLISTLQAIPIDASKLDDGRDAQADDDALRCTLGSAALPYEPITASVTTAEGDNASPPTNTSMSEVRNASPINTTPASIASGKFNKPKATSLSHKKGVKNQPPK